MGGGQRLLWLDGMKGIGILIVMIGHFCHLPNILTTGFMPLFFFAAGFTYRPSVSYSDTMRKKGKRLLIPWLVYGLIIFFVERCYDLLTHSFSWSVFGERLAGQIYMRSSFYWPFDYILQGNMLSTNGPMWFLCTLFFVFVYMVGYERCQKKRLFGIMAVLLAFITYQVPFQFPWGMELALVGMLTMLVAIHFNQQLNGIGLMGLIPLLIIATITYSILTFFNGQTNMFFRCYGTHGYLSVLVFYLQGVLYSLIVFALCRLLEQSFFIRIIAYLGKNSLRLLCTHLFIGEYTRIFFMKLIPSFMEYEYLMAIICVAIVICINKFLNTLYMKYENKYPILEWL